MGKFGTKGWSKKTWTHRSFTPNKNSRVSMSNKMFQVCLVESSEAFLLADCLDDLISGMKWKVLEIFLMINTNRDLFKKGNLISESHSKGLDRKGKTSSEKVMTLFMKLKTHL